ncbi:MAG: ATP-binding domain-containing protein [Clostridia bacterium]|nr:ATP-binding domain-containing protein [Clostridia bacterium]
MGAFNLKISIDTTLTVLSAYSSVYKTERCAVEIKKIRSHDLFLSKLAEAVIPHIATLSKAGKHFKLTLSGKHDLYFTFGKHLPLTTLKPDDVVFTAYTTTESEILYNDGRFVYYLDTLKSFEGIISLGTANANESDYKKIYRVAGTDKASFPLLSPHQKEIVETEDKNMLVQGVAGSGKTNVCIDKVIYSACREYRGRLLYSTFSRGLLIDTKSKITAFADTVLSLIKAIEQGRVKYVGNHKIAVENKLGIYLEVEEDNKILAKLKVIYTYLTEKVDYYLIADLYKHYLGGTLTPSGEEVFTRKYLKESFVQGQIAKLKNLSSEVIYKEIFGVIYGSYEPRTPLKEMISYDEYFLKRATSFSKTECEVIYRLGRDYKTYLSRNGLTDNNFMSRELITNLNRLPKYSLAVLDEVQDMTEINLHLMASLSMKLFTVGDALQMINPSYFSFAYLKRLLYQEDQTEVKELQNNYRNTKKISEIITSLGAINVLKFGTHSFVLKGVSVDTDIKTQAVKVNGARFINLLSEKKYGDYTLIVATDRQKANMRRLLGNREILTVSEAKGLERDTVILYNILSDNYDKWETLDRITVNRKTADENSVYRYYFNLLYVAVSRAKHNVYVYEDRDVPAFRDFFRREFLSLSVKDAIKNLESILSVKEVEEDELLERISKFISLGQYENARVTALGLDDELQRVKQGHLIDVSEKYIRYGAYREAGIRYWELGLYDEAKETFRLSGDTKLIEFMEASLKEESHALSYDIVRFYPDLEGNEVAKSLILDTLKRDLTELKENQKTLSARLRAIKEKR